MNTTPTITEHYKVLSKILGKKYIKSSIESPYDFISIASKGVNAHVISNFRNYFKISRELTAEMLNVSSSTMYRWVKQNRKLERNYSVLLFELADLFLAGYELFQSKDKFMKWLDLPNSVLGGLEPKLLLELPCGISKVKDLLGRIEYGVYS